MPNDNVLDLKEVIKILWDKKLIISFISFITLTLGIIYSFITPNIYTSSALMKLSDNDASGMDSMLSDYGGIANLAGISLPNSSNDKGPYIISTIRSKEFLKHLMTFDSVTKNLMAIKSYNSINQTIEYDSNIFNSDKNIWIRKPKGRLGSKPSHIEASEIYLEDMSVWQDDKSGFIYISFSHQSPFFSYDFLNLIISEVNSEIRLKDLRDSEDSLKYLYSVLDRTSDVDLRKSIVNLIESQIKIQMLANIKEDYVFTSVDSPFLPEKKSSPNRILITIISFLFGIFIGIFLVLVKFIFLRKS